MLSGDPDSAAAPQDDRPVSHGFVQNTVGFFERPANVLCRRRKVAVHLGSPVILLNSAYDDCTFPTRFAPAANDTSTRQPSLEWRCRPRRAGADKPAAVLP